MPRPVHRWREQPLPPKKNDKAVRADAEGAFTIEVPAATKNLIVTIVGYRRMVVPVKGNISI